MSVCLSVPPTFFRHDRRTATKFGTHSGRYGTHSQLEKFDPAHPRGNITSYVTSSNVEYVRHLKTTARRSMTWYYVMLAVWLATSLGPLPGREGPERKGSEGTRGSLGPLPRCLPRCLPLLPTPALPSLLSLPSPPSSLSPFIPLPLHPSPPSLPPSLPRLPPYLPPSVPSPSIPPTLPPERRRVTG